MNYGIIAAVVGVLFLAWFVWVTYPRPPKCPRCGIRKIVQEYQLVDSKPNRRCIPYLRCESCGMRKAGAIMLF